MMKLNLAHSQPMGTLIVEGLHQPFRALACALNPSSIRIKAKVGTFCPESGQQRDAQH